MFSCAQELRQKGVGQEAIDGALEEVFGPSLRVTLDSFVARWRGEEDEEDEEDEEEEGEGEYGPEAGET